MKKPKDPRRAIFSTATFFLLICGIILIGAVVQKHYADSEMLSAANNPAKASAGTNADANKAVPRKEKQEPDVIRYRNQDDGLPLELSMSEVALIDADGKDRITRLNPPATPATLAGRIAELDAPMGVMPVAYVEGERETSTARRLVTSDIRVKMPQKEAQAFALKHGLQVKELPSYAPEWVVFSAVRPMDALAKIEGVRSDSAVEAADVLLAVQQNPRALPNDPLVGTQWHIKASGAAVAGSDVNIEDVWKYGATGGIRGNGIKIGIVDDGLETAHPDLATNADTVNDKDWNGNDNDPNPGPGDDHGTACAGVAGARGNNSVGVSGTAPETSLVGMRLIAAPTTDSQEAQAMSYLPNLIQILSNSWGPADTGEDLDSPGPLTIAAFANAAATGRSDRGTIILWAGGNGGANQDNSNYDAYANSIYTIAIGATDSKGNRAGYSEPGANVVVCAPSSGFDTLGIVTTDRTGTYGPNPGDYNGYDPSAYTDDFGGTSSATPAAAGIVALMLEANPNLGWRDVQEILIRSAKKIKPADADWVNNAAGLHFNHDFGAGLIDATAAVALSKTWVNLDAQTSAVSTRSGPALAIPNNASAGVSVTFSLPDSYITTEHVTLRLSIDHTARGDLDITLTSPSGTVSRLAELRDDLNDNYTNFTLTSVRNWGESSSGNWILKIADRKSTANTTGGTLRFAELTVFGVSAPPVNTPPVVQITSPASGSVFSPGVGFTVSVDAKDFDIDGIQDTVTKVDLYENGTKVATDTTFPYSFARNPGISPLTYTYIAKATDPDGLEGESQPVFVTVKNQTPVIHSVTLNAASQAYDDLPLTVTAVDATDPENDTITLAYKWEYSTDEVIYTNSGVASATLPPDPANSGKLWRCVITASDGNTTSEPFLTGPVNLLDRPLSGGVRPGSPYTYQSGLVLRGDTLVINRQAIIHEFSQGNGGGTAEWIEILTMKAGSLSGWTLSDSSGNTLNFATGPWASVPAGTLIVVYNGLVPKDPLLPADSSNLAAGSVVISSKDTAHFTAASNWPTLDNIGDAILLKDGAGNDIHAISYGNSFFAQPNIGRVATGEAAYFAGQTDSGASLANEWLTTSGAVARSATRTAIVPASIFPAAVFTNGRYIQDFNSVPGASGTQFPTGWTSYSVNLAITQTTNYDNLTLLSNQPGGGAAYNFGSRIGMIAGSISGGPIRYDPGFIALALDNTRGLSGLQISYDIIKISEQAKKMELNLQYTTGNPGNTGTQWTSVAGAAHNSGITPTGTVTRLNNVSLPPIFQDRQSPIYLRWNYRTATNSTATGFPDGLAIDNLIISSDSSPNIFMTLALNPTTVLETAGANASTGSVTINQALSYDLTVNISSSDITEASVPASNIIPAGQLSGTFPIRAVDDVFSDGVQTSTITVSATNFLNVSQVLTVTDNEPILIGVTPGLPNNPSNSNFVDRLRTGRLYEAPVFYIAASTPLPAGLTLDSATGLISGTISPSVPLGSYTIIIEIRNVLGGFSSQTIVIDVSNTVFSSYSQWVSQYGLIDQSVNGNTDLDDLPNLIEYVLNSRPDLFEQPSPIVSARTATAISITYTKSKNVTDVTLVAEWSPTMAPGSWLTTDIVNDILVDGVSTQQIRSSVTIDPARPARFIRLRAVGPPPPP